MTILINHNITSPKHANSFIEIIHNICKTTNTYEIFLKDIVLQNKVLYEKLIIILNFIFKPKEFLKPISQNVESSNLGNKSESANLNTIINLINEKVNFKESINGLINYDKSDNSVKLDDYMNEYIDKTKNNLGNNLYFYL